MHIPWTYLAFLPLAIAPLPLYREGNVRAIRQEKESRIEEVWKERRGFEIKIDHETRSITISAWFYAARGTAEERNQLNSILYFWNQQNEKYVYRLGRGKQAVDYKICFDIREAHGIRTNEGFFIPDTQVRADLLNAVEIIPDSTMNPSEDIAMRDGSKTLGYAPNNHIYISDQAANLDWVGPHEAGHRLGASHVHVGIMQSQGEMVSNRVNKQTIKQILACAFIVGRGSDQNRLAQYGVRAQSVEIAGVVPQGFYTQGKVKKARRK